MGNSLEPAVEFPGLLLSLAEPPLNTGQGDVPHRRQTNELRMPHPRRELLHGYGCLHRGGMLSLFKLRGQPDPQALKRQLRLFELGADADDLARNPHGIPDVTRPVERPAPMQQYGGECLPVATGARHGHRPIAELKPHPIRTLGMQPVAESGKDRSRGAAFLLPQLLECFLEERASPRVGSNRRREHTAIAERRPHEQVASPNAAGDDSRLSETLVPGHILARPIMRGR
jgi:hypothetical protein